MQVHPTPGNSRGTGFPWYLLWVIGALILTSYSLRSYYLDEEVGSLVLAAAWLCWAISWYAKPFHIQWQSNFSNAIHSEPVRSWMPGAVWNLITFGALALSIAGLVLKFTNAA